MNRLKFILISALTLSFAVPLSAATINITSVTGDWTSVTGNPSNLNGLGTNEIRWGNSTGFGQSGYRFDGLAPPSFSANINVPFTLGVFTHFNQPITGNSITGAELNALVNLTIDGTPLPSMNFVYDFLHNETPNVTPCQAGSVSVCDDIVKIVNNDAFSDTFNIAGVDYTIHILGFDVNGQPFDQFMTQEGKTNIANLRAVITTAVRVPEPSTYLMMGSFLGVGALLMAYRRKQVKSS